MKLNLKQLFDLENEAITFDYQIDLSAFERDLSFPFQSPVTVKGSACNSAGVVTLSYTASFTMNLVCDRCLASFERSFCMDFSHVVVRASALQDDDDYVVTQDDTLCLDELVQEDIDLELPSKFLCKDDCKGLCSRCGADLNQGACTCKPQGDPRLAALKDLL